MRIPESELHRNYQWPIQDQDKSKLAISESNVDAFDLLHDTDTLLRERAKIVGSDYKNSIFWGDLPNLRDLEIAQHFESLTGAVKLPQEIDYKGIQDFFSPKERHYAYRGTLQNRGKSYYIAVDPSFLSSTEKIEVMKRDFSDGLIAIKGFDRTLSSSNNLLGYLGVLDYFKQHALTAFHALTYPERLGEFKPTEEYKEYRLRAANLARFFTRNYYISSLGLSTEDMPSLQDQKKEIDDVLGYLQTQDRNYKQYTVQEVDHPLRIMAHVEHTIKLGYNPDTLIALMSGGTQAAIAFQLAYEQTNPEKKVSLLYLPLSRHSANINFAQSLSTNQLREYLRGHDQEIHGKSIQVVEDNANSGQTAQMVKDALVDEKAREVRLSFVEIDPYRVLYKQGIHNPTRSDFIANFTHPDYQTAVGTLPVARSIRQDYQLRKLFVWRIFDQFNGRKYA